MFWGIFLGSLLPCNGVIVFNCVIQPHLLPHKPYGNENSKKHASFSSELHLRIAFWDLSLLFSWQFVDPLLPWSYIDRLCKLLRSVQSFTWQFHPQKRRETSLILPKANNNSWNTSNNIQITHHASSNAAAASHHSFHETGILSQLPGSPNVPSISVSTSPIYRPKTDSCNNFHQKWYLHSHARKETQLEVPIFCFHAWREQPPKHHIDCATFLSDIQFAGSAARLITPNSGKVSIHPSSSHPLLK